MSKIVGKRNVIVMPKFVLVMTVHSSESINAVIKKTDTLYKFDYLLVKGVYSWPLTLNHLLHNEVRFYWYSSLNKLL